MVRRLTLKEHLLLFKLKDRDQFLLKFGCLGHDSLLTFGLLSALARVNVDYFPNRIEFREHPLHG